MYLKLLKVQSVEYFLILIDRKLVYSILFYYISLVLPLTPLYFAFNKPSLFSRSFQVLKTSLN